ncbi:MAG: small basic protein [Planctomycetes bacterium]|jgi:small basic protein (TIGR04137 family)|nr:small basic protein [Planctomycetota bacterium]
MSIHSSLRGVSTLVGERSVFSRRERLEILAKAGKFKEGERSVLGLPKVRTRFKVAGAKKVDKKAEGADEKKGAAAPAAKAAAPAAKAPAKK